MSIGASSKEILERSDLDFLVQDWCRPLHILGDRHSRKRPRNDDGW